MSTTNCEYIVGGFKIKQYDKSLTKDTIKTLFNSPKNEKLSSLFPNLNPTNIDTYINLRENLPDYTYDLVINNINLLLKEPLSDNAKKELIEEINTLTPIYNQLFVDNPILYQYGSKQQLYAITNNEELKQMTVDEIIQLLKDNKDITPNPNKLAHIDKETQTKLDLQQKLEAFIKDNNFTIIKDKLQETFSFFDYSSVVDLITKEIYTNSDDLTREAAIVAVTLLNKTKEYNELVYNIKGWNEYEDRKQRYFTELRLKGLYDTNDLIQTVNKYILYDFIQKHITTDSDLKLTANKTYNENNFISKIIVAFRKLINRFIKSKPNIKEAELSAKRIVADILNNNISFNIKENYELKKNILLDDKLQKIKHDVENIGGILSGSAFLRTLGTLYRSKSEVVNDLDFVIPYETFRSWNLNVENIEEEEYLDVISNKLNTLLPTNYNLKTKFVGKEHKGNKSATITYEVEGEAVDIFVRTNKKFEKEFDSYDRLVTDLLSNKLQMGKLKHITDYVFFKPNKPITLARRSPSVQVTDKLSISENFKLKREKLEEYFNLIDKFKLFEYDNYYNSDNEVIVAKNNDLRLKIYRELGQSYGDYIFSIIEKELAKEENSKGIRLSAVIRNLIPYSLKNGIVADINFVDIAVNKQLNGYLVKWANKYDIQIKHINDFADSQNLSLSGAVDVINKIIYLANSENQNITTLAEEVSTMMIYMLGTKHFQINSALKQIKNYPKYEEEYLKYASLDRYRITNSNGILVPNVDKINVEILSKAIAERLVLKYENRTGSNKFLQAIDEIIQWFVNKFKNKGFLNLDVILDNIATDILEEESTLLQKKPDNFEIKTYEQTVKDNPLLIEVLEKLLPLHFIPTGSLAYRNQMDVYRNKNEKIHDLDLIINKYTTLEEAIEAIKSVLPEFWIPNFINPVSRIDSYKTWEDEYNYNATGYYGGEFIGKIGKDYDIATTIDGKEIPHTVINKETGELIKETGRDKEGNIYAKGILIDIFMLKDKTIKYVVDNKGLANYIYSFNEKLKYGRPKDALDLILHKGIRNTQILDNDFIFYQISDNPFINGSQQDFDRTSNNTPIPKDNSLEPKYGVSEKQYQKPYLNNELQTSELAIRDLAERLAYRIGGTFEIINNSTLDYSGYSEGNHSVINVAHATLDTPIHEILGHPIIRAIKNNPEQKELYDNLIEELNSGYGKEVLDRVKRDYRYKDEIRNSYEGYGDYYYQYGKYYHIRHIEGKDQHIEITKEEYNANTNQRIYTLEEQQEEALVQLLGELTAKKLQNREDAIKNKRLITLLKELLKQMTSYIRSLFNSKEIDITKLKADITVSDLAKLLAYTDSNILLPNSTVEYTTPDNMKFSTYIEASNHISRLFKESSQSKPPTNLLEKLREELLSLENYFKSEEYAADKQEQYNNAKNTLSELLNKEVVFKSQIPHLTEEDKIKYGFEKYDIVKVINRYTIRGRNSFEEGNDYAILGTMEEGKRPYRKITPISKEEAEAIWRKDKEAYYEKEDAILIESAKQEIENIVNDVEMLGRIEYKQEEIKAIEIDPFHTITDFITKNNEYEEGREIIEEWKKVNNIVYNPEEIYSRGHQFISTIGAFGSVDASLIIQNLQNHIENYDKIGSKLEFSFHTAPVNNRQEIGINAGGEKLYIIAYPKSEDIAWASEHDNYSGSIWDAPEIFGVDKKEIAGIAYTKSPSINNISSIVPNLATITKNFVNHNELTIALTPNNHRIEYDNDVPTEVKRLVDNYNNYLDAKYGNITKPHYSDDVATMVAPTQTYNNTVDILTIKDKLNPINDLLPSQFVVRHNNINEAEDEWYYKQGNTWYLKYVPSGEDISYNSPSLNLLDHYGEDISEMMWIKYNESIGKFDVPLPKKPFTNQTQINNKIIALKAVAQKYPRALIASKVIRDNEYTDRQYQKSTPTIRTTDKVKVANLKNLLLSNTLFTIIPKSFDSTTEDVVIDRMVANNITQKINCN